jgi:hypothetical protein
MRSPSRDLSSLRSIRCSALRWPTMGPACAQGSVRQRAHVLEGQKPPHQADRQRRAPVMRAVHLAQPAAEEIPIDLIRQRDQRMPHGDDLICAGRYRSFWRSSRGCDIQSPEPKTRRESNQKIPNFTTSEDYTQLSSCSLFTGDQIAGVAKTDDIAPPFFGAFSV